MKVTEMVITTHLIYYERPIGLTYKEICILCPQASLKVPGLSKMGNHRITVRDAKEAGVLLKDVLRIAGILADRNPDTKRRLQLWTADCAAHGMAFSDQPISRVKECISLMRQYARTDIDISLKEIMVVTDTLGLAGLTSSSEFDWQYERLAQRFDPQEPEDWPLPGQEPQP